MLETSFRIHRDEVTRTLIGYPPTAERQKIGFDPIATERRLRRNGKWQRQRRNGIFIHSFITFNSGSKAHKQQENVITEKKYTNIKTQKDRQKIRRRKLRNYTTNYTKEY